MDFAQKLTTLLDAAPVSRTQIAREAGIGASDLSKMASGERRPYLDQAFSLARTLGFPLDFLADDSMFEPPPVPTIEDMELRRAVDRLGHDEAMRRLQGIVITYTPGSPSCGEQRAKSQAGAGADHA
jgi:transcriptional regulator with XRE-family HTH domain